MFHVHTKVQTSRRHPNLSIFSYPSTTYLYKKPVCDTLGLKHLTRLRKTLF
jgi:hypothetical protein